MNAAATGGLGRRLAHNTLHAATGRIAAVAVWLFLTPPILAALGTDGFAVWALFFALTGYFAALDLGLVQGTLRHVSAARARGASEEAAAFVTLGVAGFVLLGLAWSGAVLLLRGPLLEWLRLPESQRGAATFAMQAGALVFVLAGTANVLGAALQGHDRFDLANVVSLTATLMQGAGILAALAAHAGLYGLVLAVGAGWAAAALLAAGLLAARVPEARFAGWSLARHHAREALAFGGPMQLASLFAVLHAHLDKFLLPGLVTLAAVTPYELGSRVLGALQTFPQMLLLAMLPAASTMHATGDATRLRALYVRGERYLLTATALLVAALTGPAARLFAVWLGPGHADAALVLRGLTVATALTLATGMASVSTRAIGRPALEAWYGAVTLVTHVVTSLLLLPRFGLAGAVFAAIATTAVASTVFLVGVARALGWRVTDVIGVPHVRPAAAAALGAGAGFALDRLLPVSGGAAGWAWLACAGAGAVVVSAGVCVATGYFPWREALALATRRRGAEGA
ncbi:MAG: polysaccharide biosynthesis C-terminal domain-containing protein [Candidatus Eisenbacteria bacterium]|uniref:Polysaccharide biosynthesis C-terminal domain-containing protein n=1 Tax=Eiseniibacteriota bacterium TaxID=2212470 RepID=A0A933W3I9_UNCEI|nr:polysaccharide biosynthesis C-terminal domain-containing protein [Candidatus Eisenbacteria bacterium]